MQTDMNAKQVNLSNALENLYQKYINDTKEKFKEYTTMLEDNSISSKNIQNSMKKIQKTKERIQLITLKTLQLDKEYSEKNNCLLKEKNNLGKIIFELKEKMAQYRNYQRKRLALLV